MKSAAKYITINNETMYATVEKQANNLYVCLFDKNIKTVKFISSDYPSTQSYIYCIRQAAREYIKHLENVKELEAWDGVII